MARKSGYSRNRARDNELRQLIDQGVLAGAEVLRDAVVEKFAERGDGYTSAEFVHEGKAPYAADIEIGPLYTERGVRRADVFTAAVRAGKDGNVPYPAMWEFGHDNLFIGEWVRVETFRPAMMENIDNVGGAMIRRIKKWNDWIMPRSGRLNVGINQRDFGL